MQATYNYHVYATEEHDAVTFERYLPGNPLVTITQAGIGMSKPLVHTQLKGRYAGTCSPFEGFRFHTKFKYVVPILPLHAWNAPQTLLYLLFFISIIKGMKDVF